MLVVTLSCVVASRSHAIAPVVIATNQSRSVIYLECIAILFHLSSNAKTILYDLLDNLSNLESPGNIVGSSREAAVETKQKQVM